MKILFAINSGFSRALKGWKGILVFWIISGTMVSFIVVPFRASLNAVLGKSMVTEKLTGGLDFDVLGDFGTNLHSIASALFSGMLLLSTVGIVVTVFLAGGLFNEVKKGTLKTTFGDFFSASAKKFLSFFIISVIIYIIAIGLIIFIIIIPVSIAATSNSPTEGLVFRTLAISGSVFVPALAILFLSADYARAWQSVRDENASFKALGFGFSQTFSNFFPSFTLMIIMIFFQLILAFGVLKVIAVFSPSTGKEVFLLNVGLQLLFVLKIFLKVMRYASVTSLMEQNQAKVPEQFVNPSDSVYEVPQDIYMEIKT